MMLIPRYKLPMSLLNRLWANVRGTPFGASMTHQAQAPLALQLAGWRHTEWALPLAHNLFSRPLRGAGQGWESRQALVPVSNAAIATTGANSVRFNVTDFMEILDIGFQWTVAGTVTAMTMDFDLYDTWFGGSLVTDKLDGTRGYLTSPSVASQAAKNVLIKELKDTGTVRVNPGQSVSANVTTTTTAGNGMPFILVIPRAETWLNGLWATYVQSS